jgi:hypothetical protein
LLNSLVWLQFACSRLVSERVLSVLYGDGELPFVALIQKPLLALIAGRSQTSIVATDFNRPARFNCEEPETRKKYDNWSEPT